MKLSWKTLLNFCVFVGISTSSNAMINGYGVEEKDFLRTVFPPKTPSDFKKEILDPLGITQKQSIRFLRLGAAVRDEDIPEIVQIIQTDLPNLTMLDLSHGNVTVEGMKKLIPLLQSKSFTTVYPSPNFVSANMPELTTALGEAGINGFDQRAYTEKIKSKPSTTKNLKKRRHGWE